MTGESFLFWFLSIITVVSALGVLLATSPVYSALSLCMTMVGVSALFFTLNAYFLAGVQLIVYAGAVMVLFVMVLMLFDLKQELKAFTSGRFTGAIKIASIGLLTGLVCGTIFLFKNTHETVVAVATQEADGTKLLGKLLFTKYLFGFEALGVLLLVVAVGTVSLARSKGGTHAK